MAIKSNKMNRAITKREVRQMIMSSRLASSELKMYGTAQTAINPSIAGTLTALSQGCSLGDASNQRDGAQITVQKIRISFNARSAATSSIRYIIIQDHQNNASAPIVADILRFANITSSYSLVVLSEQKRFSVVHDEIIDLSLNGKMTETVVHTLSKFQKKITYLGDTDVVTANGKNSFWILIIGSTVIPFYDFDFSMRYFDQ